MPQPNKEVWFRKDAASMLSNTGQPDISGNPKAPNSGELDMSDDELRSKLLNILYKFEQMSHRHRIDSLSEYGLTVHLVKEKAQAADAIVHLIKSREQQVAVEAKIEALDHVIGIYNYLFEPNGEFKPFNQLTKREVAELYRRVGEYIRGLQAQQNPKEVK